MSDLTDLQELGQKRTPRVEKPVLTGKDKLARMRAERKELEELIAEENKNKRPRKNMAKLADLVTTLMGE